jgi:hypothetical protein
MHATPYVITVEGETTTIATAAELAIALDVLQGQHDRRVLEQLRPHLAAILGGPAGLKATLRSLCGEDQYYLIAALGADLARLVGSAHALGDILAMLDRAEVEARLLEEVGAAGLRAMISTAAELAQVLEWIYGATDSRALELLGAEHLRGIIQNGYELSLVLHTLDNETSPLLLEMLGWEHVTGLVRSRRDLGYLLRALPFTLSQRLLNHYDAAQLRAWIHNAAGWRELCHHLEAAEITDLAARLGGADYAS